jgi:hypothetical protein
MQIQDIVKSIRVIELPPGALLDRIHELRMLRDNYIPVVRKKRVVKTKAARKTKVDKLIDGMTEAERLELIKALGG